MSNKMKVMSVFGTRPEAIKMCPLVKKLQRCDAIESIVCVTAQHRQMLDQVMEIFQIQPDYDLNLMKDRQTLTTITSGVINGLAEVLEKEKPDLVLVHGDTSTSFAAALAAFYHQIPVGHVEAGLRTYDKYSPFPEEINRQLTGRLAELHFSPTKRNEGNLHAEGITENIFLTGNTVIDAFETTVKEGYQFKEDLLNNIDYQNKRIVLMTAHRRENLGEPLRQICEAVKKLVREQKDIELIYPVHLNPAVRDTASAILGGEERVHLIPPLDVEDMHNLMSKSYLVMTDSGGLQEEAPSFGIPVVVLRTETERPEAVEAGTVMIAGNQEEAVYQAAHNLLTNQEKYDEMARAINPYGDGHASERIVEAILTWNKTKKG